MTVQFIVRGTSLSFSHLATAQTTRSDIAKNGMHFGTVDLSFKVVECNWRLNKIRTDKLLVVAINLI